MYRRSLAPATWKNKEAHIKKLATFCETFGLSIFKLEEYDILSYIMFLGKTLKTPGAVLNYLSTARTWTLIVAGNASAFDTQRVTTLKRGLKRTMSPTKNIKPIFLLEHLKHVVNVFNQLGTSVLVVKAFILIAFCSALRQSNLLLRRVFDREEHVLLAGNVEITEKGLELLINTSKTTTKYEQRVFIIPPARSAKYCPVVAWRNYRSLKAVRHARLAFVLWDGSPLLSKAATNLIRHALQSSTHSDPKASTLHDIRRGSVRECAKGGATLAQLKSLGGWKSDAIYKYIPKELVIKGPSTLSASLG